MKLLEYLQRIKTGMVFGTVVAVEHTVKFQKRGLPHAHILVWQKKNNAQVWYTEENLEDYIDPNDDTLKVKPADSDLHADCRIFLRTDKRATITTNWSEFRNLAKIYEGDICAFRFEVGKKCRLVLMVHRL